MINVKDKDLYVWSALLLHEDASVIMSNNDIPNSYPDYNNNYIWGIAKKNQSKLEVTFAYLHQNGISQDKKEKLIKDIEFVKIWFKDSLESYFRDKFRRWG